MTVRKLTPLLILPILALFAVPLAADARIRDKTQLTFEGMLGRMVGMFGGKAAREGVIGTTALKGDRKLTTTDNTGQIVDLGEEKVYEVDFRRKEYTVTTFEQMRERIRKQQEQARKEAARQEGRDEKDEEPQKEFEFDFDARETGQTRQIAGQDARQVIMTVTMREKGRTLDESGGFVMTADSWLGPEIPALKELAAFEMHYFQALYGDDVLGMAADQLAMVMALYPALGKANARLKQEGDKLKGTPLATTTTFEVVKTQQQVDEEMKSQESSGGSGIGGMLARRIAKKEPPKPRALILTMNHEVQEIALTVPDSDVQIPAGFKEKK